jgi:hypothetical protein
MSELIPPTETSEPIPIRTGTVTADDRQEPAVRLGSARGGRGRRVGWRHLVAGSPWSSGCSRSWSWSRPPSTRSAP